MGQGEPELTFNSRLPAVVRAIQALAVRMDVLEEIIMGDPTPQQIAEGKQLGLIGMLRKGEEDRKKLKGAMYGLVCLVAAKALLDAPTAIPAFIRAMQGLFR